MEAKNPLADRSSWIRVLYMLLFAVVFQLLELALAVVAVVQMLSRLVTGKTFPELRSLGAKMGDYARHIVAFLTFHTDDLPFPFESRRSEPVGSPEAAG